MEETFKEPILLNICPLYCLFPHATLNKAILHYKINNILYIGIWEFLKIELKTLFKIKKSNISRQNSNPKRYMHPYVHSSTIYSSQDMETT